MSVIGHLPAARAARVERTAPDGLRAALVGLGVLGVLGSSAQLAATGPTHVLPWVATILLAVSAVLLARPRVGLAARRVARALSLVVLVAAAAAVAEHLGAGPGAGVSAFTHSWYDGGTAPLAPGMLGQSALLLCAASLRAGPRLSRLGRRVSGRLRPDAGPE